MSDTDINAEDTTVNKAMINSSPKELFLAIRVQGEWEANLTNLTYQLEQITLVSSSSGAPSRKGDSQ